MDERSHAVAAPTPSSDGCDDPRRCREAPLCKRLFIINNMMLRLGDRLVAHLGLTTSRWLLLSSIAKRPEAPTLSELSEDGLLSLQNVSRMVAAMEADGLLERFSRPGQGRATFVRLTESGLAIHEQTKLAGLVFTQSFLSGLSESDTARMEGDLDRLIDNLESLERSLEEREIGSAAEAGARAEEA
ncbi:MAG: MarR family transcriptional regulator [Planctomycetota bacterium]|nr:MarR family transcriptional regulator [Planctomycetota bacterium]